MTFRKDGICPKCGKHISEHGGPYNGIYYACPPFIEFEVSINEGKEA